MSEKNLENRIKKWLKDNGIYHFKYWGGGIYTTSGIPDIIACVRGHFVALEVKSSTGKTSKLQDYNLKKINDSGGVALVVNPENWEEVKTYLGNLKGG